MRKTPIESPKGYRDHEMPLLLRAEEVAKLLGLSRSMVFQMLASGELPVVRFGRSVRVPREALDEWIKERTTSIRGPRGASSASPASSSSFRGVAAEDITLGQER